MLDGSNGGGDDLGAAGGRAGEARKRNLSSIRTHLEQKVRACQELMAAQLQTNSMIKVTNAVLVTLLQARKTLDQLLAPGAASAADLADGAGDPLEWQQLLQLQQAAAAEVEEQERRQAAAREPGPQAQDPGGAGAAGAAGAAGPAARGPPAPQPGAAQQQLLLQEEKERRLKQLRFDEQLLDANCHELLALLAAPSAGGGGGAGGGAAVLLGQQGASHSAALLHQGSGAAYSTASLLEKFVSQMPDMSYSRDELATWWGERTRHLALLLHQGQRGMTSPDAMRERAAEVTQDMAARLGAMILSQPACVEIFTLSMESRERVDPPEGHWDRVVACMGLTPAQALALRTLDRWWTPTSARMRARRQELAARALGAPEDLQLQQATLEGIQSVQHDYQVWILAAMAVGLGAILTPPQAAECHVTSWPYMAALPGVCAAADRALERALARGRPAAGGGRGGGAAGAGQAARGGVGGQGGGAAAGVAGGGVKASSSGGGGAAADTGA